MVFLPHDPAGSSVLRIGDGLVAGPAAGVFGNRGRVDGVVAGVDANVVVNFLIRRQRVREPFPTSR
ncbi:hypothetical protein R6L23_23430 [Streptomyces sp. SR27]|uniref:hypothetical protein n=1 Tax=Streptomyces sp. SR27 TaxID=3076630 RepID=UPI00295B30E2|nr:hypothetical protein [Streptomyces sp. SR27]MDV9191115.1 hypothetical protein [Streptomyces sp. SR27]